MKKRLKFVLSFFLVFTIIVSSLCIPASSYQNDIEVSTADILLINLDTNTTVYSQKPDNMWYSGYLAVLMSYLVACEKIEKPENISFKVEQEFIDELPFSDGSLDKYVGETLTAEDLMAVTLLTSGSDSAYALAYLTTGSSLSSFVGMMNDKAAELGCSDTGYISPGFSASSDQYTTCRDVARLYRAVRKTELFKKVMSARTYTPDGLDEEKFSVISEASIINDASPYYFKYTNDAKYSYSEETYAGLALTTTYRGMTYLFVGLLGLNDSEKNIYADAKKLITWAYLNLSDRKVIAAEDNIAKVGVDAGWGSYDIQLYSFNSAFKTLPNEFDDELLEYKTDIPESVSLPLIKGQRVGKAVISYDGEKVDEVDLVVDNDEGLDMLNDCGRFANYVIGELIVEKPSETVTESETDGE